jgi:hypothetical protein
MGFAMIDEVVREIRRCKEEFAARFNHDIDAMYRYLVEMPRESGRQYVNLEKRSKKRKKSKRLAHRS